MRKAFVLLILPGAAEAIFRAVHPENAGPEAPVPTTRPVAPITGSQLLVNLELSHWDLTIDDSGDLQGSKEELQQGEPTQFTLTLDKSGELNGPLIELNSETKHRAGDARFSLTVDKSGRLNGPLIELNSQTEDGEKVNMRRSAYTTKTQALADHDSRLARAKRAAAEDDPLVQVQSHLQVLLLSASGAGAPIAILCGVTVALMLVCSLGVWLYIRVRKALPPSQHLHVDGYQRGLSIDPRLVPPQLVQCDSNLPIPGPNPSRPRQGRGSIASVRASMAFLKRPSVAENENGPDGLWQQEAADKLLLENSLLEKALTENSPDEAVADLTPELTPEKARLSDAPPPLRTVVAPYEHHFAGWVWKKPRGEHFYTVIKKWKRRFFVLTPNGNVSYFDKPVSAKDIDDLVDQSKRKDKGRDRADLSVTTPSTVRLLKDACDAHEGGFSLLLVCDRTEVQLSFDKDKERNDFIKGVTDLNPNAIVS